MALQRPSHFAETEALQPWQGSSALFLEEIRDCPFWFHPITSRSLRSETHVAWVRWPLLELAAGTSKIGTLLSHGTWLDLCSRASARRRMLTAPPAMRFPLCSAKVFSSGTLLRASRTQQNRYLCSVATNRSRPRSLRRDNSFLGKSDRER